jgi:hypothetical protein
MFQYGEMIKWTNERDAIGIQEKQIKVGTG